MAITNIDTVNPAANFLNRDILFPPCAGFRTQFKIDALSLSNPGASSQLLLDLSLESVVEADLHCNQFIFGPHQNYLLFGGY